MKFWISKYRATIVSLIVLMVMMVLRFYGSVPGPIVISTLLVAFGFLVVETLICRSTLNEMSKPDK